MSDSNVEEAIETFIAPYCKNPRVVGIVIAGSYVRGEMDPRSDVDIQIVMDGGAYRERGAVWVSGVEIEYFINPFEQVRAYFDREGSDEVRPTEEMFAYGHVVYEKGEPLGKLIAESRKLIRSKRKKLGKKEKEFALYHLTDLRKDLEDVFEREDRFAFALIAGQIAERCMSLFFALHRAYRKKPKRMEEAIREIDPSYARLCKKALAEEEWEKRFKALLKLIKVTEKLAGGATPEEWRLRSRVTI